MADKVLKTKIALLYKTAAEWDAIKDTYKPLKGEVCFCEAPKSSEEYAVLFKIGNGVDFFDDLPWSSALAADVFAWAKKEHLDFNDLDQNFLDALMEYVGGEEKDTIFKLVEVEDSENHIIKLQKSEDNGETWSDVSNSAEVDLGAIANAVKAEEDRAKAAEEDLASDLADEIARAEAEEAKKVDKEVVSGNNTSLIFNEADGGGAMITTATNKGFTGVHDGSNPDQTYATMYVKNADGSQTLVRIDLDADGKAHYLKSGASAADGNEIATLADIQELSTGLEIEKQETAEEGYFATYKLVDALGGQHGAKINIPKDFLVKSAELKTVEIAGEPYPEAQVGDKYIDFVVNVYQEPSSEGEQDQHIYLPVNDLVDTYTGGKGIDISAQNEISFNASELDDGQIPQEKVDDLITDLAALDSKIDDEQARAEAEEAKKVDKEINGTNGKALIFNETDGGGAKFEGKNGVNSYVGVHDNIGGEIGSQIYVAKPNSTEVTIVDVTQNGAYYTKGAPLPGQQRDVEANELATKGDIAAVTEQLADIAYTGNVNDLVQTAGDVLILDCNG